MKYLHYYDTKTAHDAVYNGNGYEEPWVAYVENDESVTYNKDYSKNYLTVEILSDGNVTITIPANVNSSHATSISYSKDMSNWTETLVDDTAQTITIPVIVGDKVYLKGIAKQWGSSNSAYTTINSTANINVSGNAMSLLYGDVFVDKTSFPSDSQYTLCGLFSDNTHLIDASQLKLPATTLTNYCYFAMFYLCTSLTIAPELPAKTLADSCYYQMFRGCASLTTAPVLPATTLVNKCYYQMFCDCTALNYIKAMFTALPSTTYTNSWVSGVASSGTFVKNSAASWTTTGANGIPNGWTVQTASA